MTFEERKEKHHKKKNRSGEKILLFVIIFQKVFGKSQQSSAESKIYQLFTDYFVTFFKQGQAYYNLLCDFSGKLASNYGFLNPWITSLYYFFNSFY